MEYRVNDRVINFAYEVLWNEVARKNNGAEKLSERFGIDLDTSVAIVNEAAKFVESELAPINMIGDEQGAKLKDGKVELPKEWQKAYDAYAAAGWMGLTVAEKHGGQALPQMLNSIVIEVVHAANMAFGLMPMLSQGVIEVLAEFGSDYQKNEYLKPLVEGRFSGTMNLTEPHAGSDLRLIKTKAVLSEMQEGEESLYLINGQKIFITYGDHELTENIVHLVLAKIEGFDEISLFLVPKYLKDGKRNDVECIKVEHKLGIHASPTCVMSYGEKGGALGYLIGDADKGLNYMFKMMNIARHAVGVEGLAISSRSFQAALSYAKERTQGRAIIAPKKGSGKGQSSEEENLPDPVSIIHHADIQRMLLIMESSVFAMRALCYAHAWQMDNVSIAEKDDVSDKQALVELMTPIVKGWCTEIAQEVTSLSIQVHGGMGYIEETGVAQHFRDARITTIYEGTTGIQALDLISRKVIRDKGVAMQMAIDEMLELVDKLEKHAVDNEDSMFIIWRKFRDSVDDLEHTTEWILENKDKVSVIPAIAYDYMMLCGYVFAAWQLNKQALEAFEQKNNNTIDDELADKFIYMAEFFCSQLLARVMTHESVIMRGAGCVKHIVNAIYDLSYEIPE